MELGNELISRRNELIFARKREKTNWGVFRVIGCVFRVLGGLFVLLGVFSRFAAIYFARSAIWGGGGVFFFNFFLMELGKTGDCRSA